MSQPPRPLPVKYRMPEQRWRSILLRPLIWAEFACESVNHWLSRWAFIEVLDRLARFSLLVGVITYVCAADDRERMLEQQRKAKIYQAWQLVVASTGKSGDAGRRDALETLHSEDVTLYGVDLCCNALLDNLRLPHAGLNRANFERARLDGCNFASADLRDAFFRGARLDNCSLNSADLSGAMLKGAWLRAVDLTGANLERAKLQFADLSNARMTSANLYRARLRKTDLRNADLSRIENWQHIGDMTLANVHGVRNAPSGFIDFALSKGAVLVPSDDQWQVMKDRVKP